MDLESDPSGDDPRQRLKPDGGRDELNLAEFPITLLSDRVPKGCKTIVYEVEPRDRRTGLPVTRKVTITGSDAYGLPTAVDDEILVALIQLTKIKNDFSSPTVSFSRYEILRLLGWPDDGRSYRRVEESIHRWTGVTLYYDNAWWNKETGTWVSEDFHIIERSSLIDQETKRVRKARGQDALATSFFKWNEVIFQSFQSGSLKRLDVEAYYSYSTSIAKRLYRFLDKRFWHQDRWVFDLKEFAFEHVGLSRNYNVAQIKNKLQPALDELSSETKERAAFIEPMAPDERYVKVGPGHWNVVFARKALMPSPDVPPPEPTGLVADLVLRGVRPEVAAELVAANPSELIVQRLEVFDWLKEHPGRKVIKESPTGYLIASIRDRYITVPKGFESRADRAKRVEADRQAQRREAEARAGREADRAREAARRAAIDQFWESLSADDQEAMLAEALAAADPESRDSYEQLRDKALGRAALALIRDLHVARKLGLG